MTTYFHICHDSHQFTSGNLGVGVMVQLIQPFKGPRNRSDEEVEEWKKDEADINARFPEGVSFWGQKIYLGLLEDEFSYKREYCAENLRRVSFQNRLSRMQSFFCCGSVDEAIQYRAGFGVPDAEIWEVEHDGTFEKLDMNWLERCADDQLCPNLSKYWSGDASDLPVWEYLLKPPLTVIQRVDILPLMQSK